MRSKPPAIAEFPGVDPLGRPRGSEAPDPLPPTPDPRGKADPRGPLEIPAPLPAPAGASSVAALREFRAKLAILEEAVVLLQEGVEDWRASIADLEQTLADVAAQWPEEAE